MSEPNVDVARERRTLLGFALIAAAALIVGVVTAMVFTAGEPRRGEGMIPPPEATIEPAPAAPSELDPADEAEDAPAR